MTLVVMLPLGDPTLRPEIGPGERLLDLGRRFATRVADPVALRSLAADLDVAGDAGASLPARQAGPGTRGLPGGPAAGDGPAWSEPSLPAAQRCLLALAAADALAEPADPVTLLRALGAAVRVASAVDPGLTASLDDVELRSGSTQSSRDVVAAASRCTLFDPELTAAELTAAGLTAAGPTTAELFAADVSDRGRPGPQQAAPEAADGGRTAGVVPGQRVASESSPTQDLELVVDTDQQLPVAVRLVLRLAGTRQISLSGRFVSRHRQTLARVPELAGVALLDRIRRRRVAVGTGDDGPLWVTAREELPEDGPWAGWLDASVVLRLPDAAWERCAGLVVSASGPTSGTLPGSRGPGLATLVPRLAARFPVALEVVVGAPLSTPLQLDRPWWSVWGERVRLAGFRPYRRPLRPGEVSGEGDLARWAPEPNPTSLEAAVLERAAERYDLFPGRVAGAVLMTEQHPRIVEGYAWDPAVRPVRLDHLAPDGRGPGEFLVSLRSGRLSRVQPSLGRLVTALRARGPESLAENALPPGRRDELLTGLCRTGLLRRVTAA